MPTERRNSSKLLSRLKAELENPELALQGFKGLSLKLDIVNRPKESFQQLDNFDLYIPGSIRKILPSVLYGGPYGTNLLTCGEYLAQPNGPNGGILRLIGLGADGKLYDLASLTPATPYLDTSVLVGTPSANASLFQVSGFFVPWTIKTWVKNTAYNLNDAVLVYSPADGNLYVFAVTTAGNSSNTVSPTWPVSGTVTDNSVVWTNKGQPNSTSYIANYLIICNPGKRPVRVVEWQYDPTSLVELPKLTQGQMGCSQPEMPVEIPALGQITTPNLNGYAPTSGRAYLWTWYNPNTLQESSPSPFVSKTQITETDNSNLLITINGSVLLPLPPTVKVNTFTSYQSYYLSIPTATLTPPVGQGYSTIRVYATKDGGTSFFLVNTLYDKNGNQLSNNDGSIPIANLLRLQVSNSSKDYVPISGAQALQDSVRIYEGSGPINLAPDPVNLGPAAWVLGNQSNNLLYVSSGTAPDGSNSIEWDSTGAGTFTYNSIGITVKPSTQYYFQAYIDNTGGTGGSVQWLVVTPAGAVLLTKTQADVTLGTLTGTFTTGLNQKQVILRVKVSGNVTNTGSILWSNPVLQESLSGTLSTVPTNYPTPDINLLVPAPSSFANNPPPVSAMAEVFDDAIFFRDWDDPFRIWYTKQGFYELVGANNYVRTTSKVGDPVLELVRCFDRLIVSKGRAIEQINSYPPATPSPVDPQHGVRSYRSSVPWGSSLLSLLTDGLGQVKLAASIIEDKLNVGLQSELFGDDVKPIIDSINPNELYSTHLATKLPSPAVLNNSDLYMLAYAVGNGFNDNILLYYLGRSGGFSNITALPNDQTIITLKEVQLPSGGTGGYSKAGSGASFMIALCSDSKSYVVFGGTQDGTVTATAVTQPLPTTEDLPTELWDTDKSFLKLYVEGQDLQNFNVSFSIDGGTSYCPAKRLTKSCRIGMRGKNLVIKFTHSVSTLNVPILSYVKVWYNLIGVNNTGLVNS